MGLYCSGGLNPALLLHTWLGLKLRGSVGTCYLFDQGWTVKENAMLHAGSLRLLGRRALHFRTSWKVLWDRV